MKPALTLFKYFGLVFIAVMSFSSSARANSVFIDDGLNIYSYPAASALSAATTFSNKPGAGVIGMGFTGQDTNLAPQNLLLTAASGNNKIYAYTQQGVQSVFASVNDPVGLAVNSAGDVYTATNGTTIQEFSPVGVLMNADVASGLFVGSLGVDVAGNVYEADEGTDTINEYYVGGGSRSIPVPDQTDSYFYGMTFDSAGDLFLDYWNGGLTGGGIYEMTPGGVVTTFLPTQNFGPTGLGFDPLTGNLYLTYVNSITANDGGGADVFVYSGGTLSNTPVAFANGLDDPYGLAVLTPEPGSLLLLAGGLISFALLRFHRVRLKTCRANSSSH